MHNETLRTVSIGFIAYSCMVIGFILFIIKRDAPMVRNQFYMQCMLHIAFALWVAAMLAVTECLVYLTLIR